MYVSYNRGDDLVVTLESFSPVLGQPCFALTFWLKGRLKSVRFSSTEPTNQLFDILCALSIGLIYRDAAVQEAEAVRHECFFLGSVAYVVARFVHDQVPKRRLTPFRR